jgi:hypothetical protein
MVRNTGNTTDSAHATAYHLFLSGDEIMDKVDVLCDKDRHLMEDFSRRCIRKLTEHTMFRMFTGFCSGYMDENVKKEIAKDRYIIENAARHFNSGYKLEEVDTHAAFEKTKEIDNAFLRKLSTLPLLIHIRYQDIEGIRMERIHLMSRVVYELLKNWNKAETFDETVRNTYIEADFKDIISLMLHLYNRETKMLASFLSIRGPVAKLGNVFAEALFTAMEQVKDHMADEITKSIFS